jgi:NADH dehydrogenase (ubiquinone) 1 alpha subcomplex subunit 6
MAEARQNVIDLYRTALRLVPEFNAQYELSHSPSYMRARIRRDFEKHKNVSNPLIVDKLMYLGRIQLEEAKNKWAQTNTVDAYFSEITQSERTIGQRPTKLPVTPDEDNFIKTIQQEALNEKTSNKQYRDVF